MRWRRKKPEPEVVAEKPDETRLLSEVLGYEVEPGSPAAEMSAALASDAISRLEALREQGLWTDELERRWNAVEELARSGADVEALTDAVDALLDEATRVRSDP
jgi:hypothetical protein